VRGGGAPLAAEGGAADGSQGQGEGPGERVLALTPATPSTWASFRVAATTRHTSDYRGAWARRNAPVSFPKRLGEKSRERGTNVGGSAIPKSLFTQKPRSRKRVHELTPV